MGQGKGRPRLALSPDYDHPKRLDQRWRPAPLQIDSSCRGGCFVTRGPVLTSDDRTLAATAAEGLERLAIACSVTYLIVQTPHDHSEVMAPQLLRAGYRAAPEIMAPHNHDVCAGFEPGRRGDPGCDAIQHAAQRPVGAASGHARPRRKLS